MAHVNIWKALQSASSDFPLRIPMGSISKSLRDAPSIDSTLFMRGEKYLGKEFQCFDIGKGELNGKAL
jgi:hypothetical protein